MVTFPELVTEANKFMRRWQIGASSKEVSDAEEIMRNDLLALIQKSIEYGEQKDRSKVAGILTTAVQMFMKSKG